MLLYIKVLASYSDAEDRRRYGYCRRAILLCDDEE